MQTRDISFPMSLENIQAAIVDGYPNLRTLGHVKSDEVVDEFSFEEIVPGMKLDGSDAGETVMVRLKISKEKESEVIIV